MSLVRQNSFLEAPLQQAIELYNKQIVPRLTKKNKMVALSAAVALSLFYIIREKILKPPRKLRHIPHVNYIETVKSMFGGKESLWERTYRVYLPLVDAADNKGVYMEYGRAGWIVHVSNPEDAKRILLKHELFPKADIVTGNEMTLNGKFSRGPNIVFLNGPHWKEQRKVANPAFRRSMPVKLFAKLTQDMFEAMESMDETVDATDLFERFTLQAIGQAGFGFDFNAISDRDSKWVKIYNAINDGMRDPKFFLFPSFDTTFLWMFPKRQAVHRQMDEFLTMMNSVIQNKKKALKEGIHNDALEENEKDLLTLMLESTEEGEGIMSDRELMSNLCVFFLAGHDTTANALSFAIHYLAENPDIQQKAREEAISILSDEPIDILPTVEDTKKMFYINQIMKETLRINGPATRVVPRIAMEDTVLPSGTVIPKDTLVTVNIFNIQHSEKVWKDADKFNPDRFSDNGETHGTQEGLAWLPFGSGSRQCLGMNFSLNEQRVMLSMLLRKFTWETPKNSVHKNGLKTIGLGVVGPKHLDITFHKRY